MTYYNRLPQLLKTLDSFDVYTDDFSVVVCNDSEEELMLPKKKYPITVVSVENKKWIDNEVVYNQGIIEALKDKPEVIILQNAECAHVGGDILQFVKRNINDSIYFSFACYSLSEKQKLDNFTIKAKEFSFRGEGWYNHSIYRPKGYDFCSAISTTNLIKLNGYDERLAYGWAYGDDDFLNRVTLLGLKVHIIDYPYVVHQWHYTNPVNKREAVSRNKKLYQEFLKSTNYKAKHIITKDL